VLRVLIAETWDPDGAMYRWLSAGLDPAAVAVLTVPTQELLGLVGPDGVAAAFRAITAAFKPDLVLVHPPYDFLDAASIAAIHVDGAAVVAFAFDEPLFATPRNDAFIAARFKEIAGRFDRYLVTGREDVQRLLAAGIRAERLRFAVSEAPFEARAPAPAWLRPPTAPLEQAAVIVGRAYPRRVELVTTLAKAGVPIAVFGHGWTQDAVVAALPETVGIGTPLSRAQMNTVLATAGAVVTTGDWEQVAVPMVKYRILEAAILGAPQAVQASVDLPDYFDDHEVFVWNSPDACVDVLRLMLADQPAARAAGARSRESTLGRHLAVHRLAEIVALAGITPTAPSPAPAIPPAWELLASVVAHDAERRGATALAAEAFARWDAATAAPDASAGLSRLALQALLDDRAPDAPAPTDAPPARLRTAIGLAAQVAGLPGLGLGHLGLLDPSPERLAFEFARDPAAFAWDTHLGAAPPDTVVIMASMLVPPSDDAAPPDPAVTAAWHRLWREALAARPQQRDDLVAAHAERWRAHLA
jgi:hypothetical protein